MWGIYPDNPDGYEKTAELKRDGKYSLKVTATEEYTILFHSVTIGGGNNEMKAGGFYVIEGYALSQAENGGTVKPRVNFQNVISASEKPTLGAVDATQLTEAIHGPALRVRLCACPTTPRLSTPVSNYTAKAKFSSTVSAWWK